MRYNDYAPAQTWVYGSITPSRSLRIKNFTLCVSLFAEIPHATLTVSTLMHHSYSSIARIVRNWCNRVRVAMSKGSSTPWAESVRWLCHGCRGYTQRPLSLYSGRDRRDQSVSHLSARQFPCTPSRRPHRRARPRPVCLGGTAS